MSSYHEPDVSRHVESTLEFLCENQTLRRLLALTYARAEAGKPAIDMVWGLFCGNCAPPWNLIHLSGDVPTSLSILEG